LDIIGSKDDKGQLSSSGKIRQRETAMPITPQDFVSKWKCVTACEKQTYQEQVSNKMFSGLDIFYTPDAEGLK
jgi:hypothetical protein